MIQIYNIGSIILALIFSPVILIVFSLSAKFRAGFFQKIGFYKKLETKKTGTERVVVHAVSVGEVNAVENFVKTLREKAPVSEIILTTTTKTGQEVANAKLKDVADEILYFPYDFSFSVNSFLNAIKPDKIIIAETEIWPNISKYASKKGAALYIINGRISPSSHNGYKKIKFFLKNVLANYTKILMQTEGDARRIVDIGAPERKVSVMGNVKFDIHKNMSEEEAKTLRKNMELNDDRLFVAASTHKGEDELALSVYLSAKEQFPKLKLLIAPRHPERFAQVEELIKNTGLNYSKRSANGNFKDNDIILLDTMGELAKLYSLAYVVFVGGSFSNLNRGGGHNPLEANIWGVPVISGPTVFNFKDIYKSLIQTKAAAIVKDEAEFKNLLLKFLQDDIFYHKACDDTKKIFDTSRGAVDKAIQEIDRT